MTQLGIIGRERSLIDGLAKLVHKAAGGYHECTDVSQVNRGSTFLVRMFEGRNQWTGRVARVTVELDHVEGARAMRTEEQLTENVPWWKVPLRDGFISVETRPYWCDRGRYICKMNPAPGSLLALEFDAQDGWPRYYFDWERMLAELEAWAEKRNQVPS